PTSKRMSMIRSLGVGATSVRPEGDSVKPARIALVAATLTGYIIIIIFSSSYMRSNMGKLDGRVAVVTGGSSGIGLPAAKRLATHGPYVFITGRRQSELDAAVTEIGHDVTAVRGDVAKLADLDRLFQVVKEQKGRVDILFANAGIAEPSRLGEISEELFDR